VAGRHHLLKAVQDAAPVLLKSPARIEALFCCQFLALLVAALIEREVRAGMRSAALAKIPLYQEFRGCAAPSTERTLEIFANVTRRRVPARPARADLRTELTPQQLQVLDPLGCPSAATPTLKPK